MEEETLSTLLDACVNAHVIGEQIKDGGRLLKKVRQLKDAYLQRKPDLFEGDPPSDQILRNLQELHDTLDRFVAKTRK